MFTKLKARWKVNSLNLFLVICTFALGGSLCGYLGKNLMGFTDIEKGPVWVIVYVIVVSLLWPLCVLLISIPFFQFTFFKNYLIKIGKRMTRKKAQTNIAIFASGAGSNAQKIIDYFKNSKTVTVSLVVCNKPGAGVLGIAATEKIDSLLIQRERFNEGDAYIPELIKHNIDFIILAGFLWKVPVALIQQYPNKIVNIHPALLPKYGGKGMYGSRVHTAVLDAGEKESGITIHFVDEIYDHGKIIFQDTCAIDEKDNPDTLAHKIHLLEHAHYPQVIANLLHATNNS